MAMINPNGTTLLNAVKPFKTAWKVEIKVLHSWTQHSYYGGGDSLEFILADVTGDKIHCTCKQQFTPGAKRHMQIGQWCFIENFGLTQATGTYRATNHKYKLSIIGSSLVTSSNLQIDDNFLSLTPYKSIINGSLDSNFLIDVIGQANDIGDLQVVQVLGKERKRLELTLTDANDQHITCCLWGPFAEQVFNAYKVVKDEIVCLVRFAKILVSNGQVKKALLLRIVSSGTEMETPNSLGKISGWENMERNILAKIFGMLNVIDIIKGASRVCVSWFLASHDKALWKTIDLSNIKSIISKNPDKADDLSNDEEHQYDLRNILAEITKFNSSVATNLLFDNCYYIQEEELTIIAPRMPNVQKLSLPLYRNINENSLMFTFSQWKNLQTLVITQPGLPISDANIRAIGENCKTLTSLKFVRPLNNGLAHQIVNYFSNLKSLSLRGAALYIKALFSLVTYHQNLRNLNLSHCLYIDYSGFATVHYDNYIKGYTENLVQTASQKLDTFIVCPNHCETCNELRERMRDRWDFHNNYCSWSNEQWKTDEIKELEF